MEGTERQHVEARIRLATRFGLAFFCSAWLGSARLGVTRLEMIRLTMMSNRVGLVRYFGLVEGREMGYKT